MKPPILSSPGQLLTVPDVADRLQVSPRTVRRLIASEKIKVKYVGRLVRITPAAYQAYLTDAAGE